MRTLSLLTLLGLGVLSVGCGLVDDENTGEDCGSLITAIDPGQTSDMEVEVRDEKGRPVCGAKVTARDGEFEQALYPNRGRLDACEWYLMPDRFGTYEITVEAAGFRTATMPGVEFTSTSFSCARGPAVVKVTLEHEAAR